MALCGIQASPRAYVHSSAGSFRTRCLVYWHRVKHAWRDNPTAIAPAWGLSGIVLIGTLLRFAGLGQESIWLDEVTSIIIARMPLSSVVAWAAGDIHPPLYYVVLHFWLSFGESEFAVRALSALLGVLTIAVIYALAAKLFDRRIGLVSALLLALAPLHIWYSQEARMYVMVTALSLLSSYLMILALRGQQLRYWVAYIATSAFAAYTHYFALYALVFLNVFAIYKLRSKDRVSWRRWLAAQVAVALVFAPWLPVLYHQVTTGGGGWVERSLGKPSLYTLVDTWLYFSIGLDNQLYPVLLRRAAYALFAVCALAAVLPLLGWLHGRVRRQAEREGVVFCLIYLSLPVLTVWTLSQAKPMYSVRYLLIFLPPYCMLVAKGICALRWKGASIAVALLLAMTLLVGSWNAWRTAQNPDWRGVTSYVLAHAQPKDVVLFSPRWNAKPFDYYGRGAVDINLDLPIPVTSDAAEAVADDIAQRYDRVWLVWTRGHYSDPEGVVTQLLQSRYEMLEDRDFGVDRLILFDLRARGRS